MQLPLFLPSFVLTGYNPRYITRLVPLPMLNLAEAHEVQGKGKSSKEIHRRIDYGSIVTTLAWVHYLSILLNLANDFPRTFQLCCF